MERLPSKEGCSMTLVMKLSTIPVWTARVLYFSEDTQTERKPCGTGKLEHGLCQQPKPTTLMWKINKVSNLFPTWSPKIANLDCELKINHQKKCRVAAVSYLTGSRLRDGIKSHKPTSLRDPRTGKTWDPEAILIQPKFVQKSAGGLEASAWFVSVQGQSSIQDRVVKLRSVFRAQSSTSGT